MFSILHLFFILAINGTICSCTVFILLFRIQSQFPVEHSCIDNPQERSGESPIPFGEINSIQENTYFPQILLVLFSSASVISSHVVRTLLRQ